MEINLAEQFDKSKTGGGLSSKKVLQFETFLRIGAAIDWDEAYNASELVLNIDGFDILNHDGLTWIQYICLRRASQNRFTYISLPNDEQQIAFMDYIGFHRLQQRLLFGYTDEFKLSLVKSSSYTTQDEIKYSPRRIQMVTRLNWTEVTSGAMRYFREYLYERLDITPQTQDDFEHVQPFIETIQELIMNIPMHGGTDTDQGIGLISYTPPPAKYDILRFYCCDLGRGMKFTLDNWQGQKCRDDNHAIVKALLFRFFNQKDGVLGLYPTLQFIRKKRGLFGIRTGRTFGVLDLSSEASVARFDDGYVAPTEKWLISLMKFYPSMDAMGTHIFVDLKLTK